MVNIYDKYQSRITRKGNNIGDIYKNNTVNFIDNKFKDSPTYRLLNVKSAEFPDIQQMDARVVELEKSGVLREVIFRPNESLNIGAYVGFDNDTWILFDKYGGQGSISVKAVVALCNRKLKWRDINNNIVEVDCVASATDLGSKAKQSRNDLEYNKFDVQLPTGQLFAFVELNEKTKMINLNDRFIFEKNVYEVVGFDDITLVDKNGFGVIQFVLKITTKQLGDDFINKISNRIVGGIKEEDADISEKLSEGRVW
jgi:hypothetical protein